MANDKAAATVNRFLVSVIVVSYLVALAVWIYSGLVEELGTLGNWIVILVINLPLGFVLGRPAVVLLGLAVIPISVPAGYPDEGELPVYAAAIFPVAPIAMLLIACGVGLRSVISRTFSGRDHQPHGAGREGDASRARPTR